MTNTLKEEEKYTFKVLVVGDKSSGKAKFIKRFIEDIYKEDDFKLIDFDPKIKYVKRENKKIRLIIWDREYRRFKSIPKNFYKGIHGIILSYDISNINSFIYIKDYINTIKENNDISKLAIIIVGNKCDLPESKRAVNEEMKKNFEIENNIKIYEASAKENINVTECFMILVDKLIELGVGKEIDDDDDDKEVKLKIERTTNYHNCYDRRGKKK